MEGEGKQTAQWRDVPGFVTRERGDDRSPRIETNKRHAQSVALAWLYTPSLSFQSYTVPR
jgi:hypothetical protein